MIDKAMAEVREYNARHPEKPLAVRLRVWGGFKAPGWATKLGGPPIAAVHNKKNRRLGRFWSPAYREAWARLHFDNHNLDTKLPRPLVRIYAWMKNLGPEIVFQTGGTNPKDFDGTIKKGVEMGATSIELWGLRVPTVPSPKLKQWAAMIEANKTP